ncbi:MAG: DUF726 domain-containing protein, partial [Candidatus Omnitrophica bacterium]|nr:DUF726 domain-containing protein [Candidatus Omnitrophota bacterium]
NDNITWSAPEPYRWSKNIVLPSGDGTKTIYAKAKDAAGNWLYPAHASIILNTQPPDDPNPPDDPQPPDGGESKITFSSPYNGQILEEKSILIGGRLDPYGHISNITVNGQPCKLDVGNNIFTGPTLLAPGEARRRNVEADSPDYIIMKVDPETHAGRNILTAQVTDDAGHITKEKITFYYYQLSVKSRFEYRNPTFPDMYIQDEDQEWWNVDLFKDPPFSGWENPQMNIRWRSPLGNAWRYYFSETNYFRYMDVREYIYLNKEDSEGNKVRIKYCLTLKTDLSFHTFPQTDPRKKTPMVLIFKDCTMLENIYDMPAHPLPVIGAKYKIESVDLNWLATRTSYNYFGGSDRDFQDYYIILEDYIPDTDKVLKVEGTFIEDDNSGLNFCQKFFCFELMDTLTGDILVDSNNDGFLGGDDNAVEQAAPGCVLWVNDDDDYDESSIHPDDAGAVDSNGNDGYDGNINGIRDLEDFMPINISIPTIKEWADPDKNVKFFLKAGGSGKIKIFERVKDTDEYEDFTYLKDLNSSIVQFTRPIILNLASGDKKELESKYFDDDGNFRAIFEGIEQGTLKLSLIVELGKDKTEVILDETYVTLKNIRDMYRFIDVRNGPSDGSDGKLRYRTINAEKKNMFMKDPGKIFMFIHGAWTSKSDAITWSNTVYKRLYRTGYRGGFVGFAWDSDEIGAPISLINPKLTFDNEWVNSFQTGQVLADVIENTKNEFKNVRINLMAHSLGGNLTSYALKVLSDQDKKQIVNNVFLIQVAVPGNAYAGRPEIDYYKDMYVSSAGNNVTGNVYNLYHENDRTLSWFNDDLAGEAWTIPLGIQGLPVPLSDNYELLSSNQMYNYYQISYYRYERSESEALGRQNLNSMLSNFISHYRKSDTLRPFGIRNHLSFGIEYYYDVMNYYTDILDPKEIESYKSRRY